MYIISKSFLTANRSNKPLVPKGIVVHSTATEGATDQAEVKYFNAHPERQASAHAFVDWDSITNTVPYNERAWHAGGTANRQYLGIELCEPKGHDVVKFMEVWNRAAWYFAWLFINVLNINTVTKNNLLSHAEVSAKWEETNHQDPIAYFKSYGKSVEDFRLAVQEQIRLQLGAKRKIS